DVNMQLNDITTQQSAAHDCHSRILLSGLSRGCFWESSLKYHLYQEMIPISESWLSFSGNQINFCLFCM
ncbi:MAG: hypothetical protein K9K37_11575, partial [Desulfocapsa sp.]|nr:hypothetical protein [Desulfocapsa sp.]